MSKERENQPGNDQNQPDGGKGPAGGGSNPNFDVYKDRKKPESDPNEEPGHELD